MSRGDDFVEQAKERVQFDVEEGFKGLLSARTDAQFAFGLHDSDLDDDTAFATSDQLVVLPWRFPCTHTGTFLDIPATELDLELRGTTFVDIRDDAESTWTYYRYVDYLGALHQLGVPTVARPVVTTPDDGTSDAPEVE
jgi:hypothetical protein